MIGVYFSVIRNIIIIEKVGCEILTFHVVEQSLSRPVDDKKENDYKDDKYRNNYPRIEFVLYICGAILLFILYDLYNWFEGENPSTKVTPVD